MTRNGLAGGGGGADVLLSGRGQKAHWAARQTQNSESLLVVASPLPSGVGSS